MDWYGAPDGEYAQKIVADSEGYPGSDPQTVARHLFEERGVDIAILHPMTRGTLPDFRLDTAIMHAHNQMLVERWLDDPEYGDRFRGTIRINMDDIKGALRRSRSGAPIRGWCRSASRSSHARCTGSRSSCRSSRRRRATGCR